MPTDRRTKRACAKAPGRLYIALERPPLKLLWSVLHAASRATPALREFAGAPIAALPSAGCALSKSRSSVLRWLIPGELASVTALPSASCPFSHSRSPVLRSLIAGKLSSITALSATSGRALFNPSSSASPALICGGCATVWFCRRGAFFAATLAAALTFLLLFVFPLGYVLLCNMARHRLGGHSNQYRYRKYGTGKPLHLFSPVIMTKNKPDSGL